jgi:c-di-GMP-binding flagellar brake protein YcgR
MSIERRRFPRVSVEKTDLKLAASRAQQSEVKIDRLIDFSLGGLQIELAAGEESPRVGSLLDIELAWPGGEQRFDASVRHVSQGTRGLLRIGIEFDDPDLVDKLLGTWFRKTGE